MHRWLVLVFLAFFSSACASSGPGWLMTRVDEAAAEKKPLVVEFYATWCKPCRHFEAHILPDPRVQAALAGFVFVRYDIDTTVGRDAYNRCQGKALPMVVGIDAEGVIRLQKVGQEPTADNFLTFLAEAEQVLGGKAPPPR
jgi:thiol:disulfide interchange protein